MSFGEQPYRPDIDGLRAISVLSVVFYHFGVPRFDGGFVGVDVFFVISGYLITGIILSGLHKGGFDFGRFYERRARRLLPTLAIVLLVTFLAALHVMTPQDLEELSRSMFYALIFTANFFFDSQGGYFGPNLELAPLLHTWSLAVEEQFYIVWPALLCLAFRYLPRYVFVAVALLLLASFYANFSLVDAQPMAAFYRPHARAWELLAGCAIALGAPPVRGLVAHLMGAAGLGLILFAVFTFSKDTAFPGLAALAPVAGAALVIWSGQSAKSLVARALSMKPLVFVGLVSYAWYLWHWPMVSLFRYRFERDPGAWEVAALLLASFALAVLCWKFVETPIRHGAAWKPRARAVTYAAVVSLSLVALAGAGYATDGFIDRYPKSVRELSHAVSKRRPAKDQCLPGDASEDPNNVICRLWEATRKASSILVWGDSHARVLRPAFRDIGKANDVTISDAGIVSCPPLIGVGRIRSVGSDKCAAVNRTVAESIQRYRFSDVVLVARWNDYAIGEKHKAQKYLWDAQTATPSDKENRLVIERGLQRTIDLIQAMGARAWIILEVPYVGFDTPNRLVRALIRGGHPQTLFGIDVPAERERSAFMRGIVARLPVRVIEPAVRFCDTGRCLAVADGKPLYFDDNHLSMHGVEHLEPLLAAAFSLTLKENEQAVSR